MSIKEESPIYWQLCHDLWIWPRAVLNNMDWDILKSDQQDPHLLV